MRGEGFQCAREKWHACSLGWLSAGARGHGQRTGLAARAGKGLRALASIIGTPHRSDKAMRSHIKHRFPYIDPLHHL